MYVGCRLQRAIEGSLAGTRFLVSILPQEILRSGASSPDKIWMFRRGNGVNFGNAALLGGVGDGCGQSWVSWYQGYPATDSRAVLDRRPA